MNVYLSPLELWQDFDAAVPAPEINVIKESADGDLVTREFYFTAWTTPKGSVRVYARFCFNKRTLRDKFLGQAPVAVIMGGLRTGKSDEINDYVLTELEGVSTFTFDYYGVTPNKERYTLYPDDLDFANYYQHYVGAGHHQLGRVFGDPKDTAWYVWAAIAKKSITVLSTLDEVNPDRMGVIGVKTGGKLAWILAAVDKRIKSAVSLFNCGWQGYLPLYSKNKDAPVLELDEKRAAYLASLATQSYAPFVKTPMLAVISTNDHEKTFDRSFDTFARVPQELDAVLAVQLHTDKEVLYQDRNLIKVWLAKYLLSEDIGIPAPPKLKLKESGGKLYIDILCDLSDEIQSLTVYQATETADPADRNWDEVDCESVGDGEYLGVGDVIDTDEYYFCYATARYKNGLVVSSNLSAVIPRLIGVTEPNRKASRLLFDSTVSGAHGFFAADTGQLFHSESEVGTATGPLNLKGVKANAGGLATYRPGDPAFKAYDDDRLLVGFYSPQPQSITITVRERTDGGGYTDYRCTFAAVGGEVWDKQTLSAAEFKAADNSALNSFENVFMLKFAAAQTFIVNNILWV